MIDELSNTKVYQMPLVGLVVMYLFSRAKGLEELPSFRAKHDSAAQACAPRPIMRLEGLDVNIVQRELMVGKWLAPRDYSNIQVMFDYHKPTAFIEAIKYPQRQVIPNMREVHRIRGMRHICEEVAESLRLALSTY